LGVQEVFGAASTIPNDLACRLTEGLEGFNAGLVGVVLCTASLGVSTADTYSDSISQAVRIIAALGEQLSSNYSAVHTHSLRRRGRREVLFTNLALFDFESFHWVNKKRAT